MGTRRFILVVAGSVIGISVVLLLVHPRRSSARPPSPEASDEPSSTQDASLRAADARQRRDEMRAKILKAIWTENAEDAGAAAAPVATARAAGGRDLTRDLHGVPAGNFPTEYFAEIYKEQLGPMTRACFAAARERNPRAAGDVTIRYVVVGAPGVGGVVEDADVDESSLDDEFTTCIRESTMALSFERAPDRGGFLEAGFQMGFPLDASSP